MSKTRVTRCDTYPDGGRPRHFVDTRFGWLLVPGFVYRWLRR